MCGRSSLTKTEKEIEARFNATFYSDELERYNPLPNFNIAPTHFHPVIHMDDLHRLSLFRWGLIPSWANDKSIGPKMINARIETITQKSAFKRLIMTKRCIVPMDGFYEWKKSSKDKIPYRIVTTNQDIFSVAGLWDVWINPQNGDRWLTFTIITLPSNEIMQPLHDRMPAILTKETETLWLDTEFTGEDALSTLQAYPSENMRIYQVSDRVNSVKNNDADLINPANSSGRPIQTSLF